MLLSCKDQKMSWLLSYLSLLLSSACANLSLLLSSAFANLSKTDTKPFVDLLLQLVVLTVVDVHHYLICKIILIVRESNLFKSVNILKYIYRAPALNNLCIASSKATALLLWLAITIRRIHLKCLKAPVLSWSQVTKSLNTVTLMSFGLQSECAWSPVISWN